MVRPQTWLRVCCKAVFAPVVRPFLRDSDTDEEGQQKWLIVPLLATVCFIYTCITITNIFFWDLPSLIIGAAILAMCAAVLGVLYVKGRLPRPAIGMGLFVYTVVNILSDIQDRGFYGLWMTSVVAMDLGLLLNLEKWMLDGVRGTVVVYLLLKMVEDYHTFGMYTIFPDESGTDAVLQCQRENLSTASFFMVGTTRLAIFLIDYGLTERFAFGMFRENQKVKSSIALAENVARALVSFDLYRAEELLDEQESPLNEAFKALLRNLHMYRPFLPQGLFEVDTPVLPVRLPGSGGENEKVAIVFTDIQSSTAIWEAHEEGMKHALDIHNRVMRKCIAEEGGYEVKTIGDAFMVAFDDPAAACRFCLSAQTMLYESKWPEEVLRFPACTAEEGLWNGLRVRMGVHYGVVNLQDTGRPDYFGTTVNIAARVESVAAGGSVVITEAVYDEVDLEELGNPAVHPLGRVPLKGLTVEAVLYCMLPRSFSTRLEKIIPMLRTGHHQHESRSPPRVDRRLSLRGARSLSLTASCAPAFMRNPMSCGWGTVAHATVQLCSLADTIDPFAVYHDVMTVMLDLAERTEGVVLTVYSGNLLVSWSQKKCDSLFQAMRFAGWLKYASRDLHLLQHSTVGICTGGLLNCHPGKTVRFATQVGHCIELAGSLALTAARLKTFALAAVVEGPIAMRDGWSHLARPVDIIPGGAVGAAEGDVTVYEVRPAEALHFKFGSVATEDGTEIGWSDEYANAVRRKDVQWLRLIANDDMVLNVAELIDQGRHLELQAIPGFLLSHYNINISNDSSRARSEVSEDTSPLGRASDTFAAYHFPMR